MKFKDAKNGPADHPVTHLDQHNSNLSGFEHVPDTMYVVPLVDERIVLQFCKAVHLCAEDKGVGKEIEAKLNQIKLRLETIVNLATLSRYALLGEARSLLQFTDEIQCLVHEFPDHKEGSHHTHEPAAIQHSDGSGHSPEGAGNPVTGINLAAATDLFAGATFISKGDPEKMLSYVQAIVQTVEKAVAFPLFFAKEAATYLGEGDEQVTRQHAGIVMSNAVQRLLTDHVDCSPSVPSGFHRYLSYLAEKWVKENLVTTLFDTLKKALLPVNCFHSALVRPGDILEIEMEKNATSLQADEVIVLFTPHQVAKIVSIKQQVIQVEVPRFSQTGPVLVLSKKAEGLFKPVEIVENAFKHQYPNEWENSLFSSVPFNKWAYPLFFKDAPVISVTQVPQAVSFQFFNEQGKQIKSDRVPLGQKVTIKYELYPFVSDADADPEIEVMGVKLLPHKKQGELKIFPQKEGPGQIRLKWQDFFFPLNIDVFPLAPDDPHAPFVEQLAGVWDAPMINALSIVGVHAVVLHTGKVLYFSFDYRCVNNIENIKRYFADPNLGSYQVWDPVSGSSSPVRPVGRNVFCAGQCQLADGTIFVAGGQDGAGAAELTNEWDKYFAAGGIFTFFIPGLDVNNGASKDVHTYNPVTDIWDRWPDMKDNRYYPTCQVLGDGSAMVVAGLSNLQRFIASGNNWCQNDQYEIYANGNLSVGAARLGKFRPADQYPIIKLLPGTPHLFTHIHNTTYLFDINSGEMVRGAEFIPPIPVGRWTYPMQTGHVLLPQLEGESPRILVVGGSTHSNFDYNTQSDAPSVQGAYIFEYNLSDPLSSRWRMTRGNPSIARLLTDTVLLPDGTVLIVNGISGGAASGHNQPPVFNCEIFDPVTELFSQMAMPDVDHPRAYHSTAVLLPDARVAIAGHTAAYNQPSLPDDTSIQVFNPPYLYRAPRPVVQNVPAFADYEGQIEIAYMGNVDIARLMMMRPCAVTHTVDMDQRAIWIPITVAASNPEGRTLSFRMPQDRSLAPPGYYMLFFISDIGVPSVASWVLLGREGIKEEPVDVDANISYPTVHLGTYENGANVSSIYEGNIVIEKIDQHCNVNLESRHGSIIINQKCDQHCFVRLKAKTTVHIGEKIDQHCNVTIQCEGDVTIGQKIDGNSQARITTVNGSVSIGEKIDGNSSVIINTLNSSIFIGQKIDGNSDVQLIAPNGTIRVVQKIGNNSKVTWHANSLECPDISSMEVIRS